MFFCQRCWLYCTDRNAVKAAFPSGAWEREKLQLIGGLADRQSVLQTQIVYLVFTANFGLVGVLIQPHLARRKVWRNHLDYQDFDLKLVAI
jgi:hypothetical protein